LIQIIKKADFNNRDIERAGQREMETGYEQPGEKENYLFKLTNLNYETWAPAAMKHLLIFPDT
jgi:hypothetical protein